MYISLANMTMILNDIGHSILLFLIQYFIVTYMVVPANKKKILRIETCFSVRSISPSRWKPYTKKDSKDRNLLLGSINITEQVDTLH